MRVLVVEDCPSLASLAARALSEQGIATDVAHDSSDAVAKLTVYRYDVAVVDASLVDIAADKLRSLISDAVMVMMLGGPTTPERVKGLSAGADDYLSKPFHPAELVLRVRALAVTTTIGRLRRKLGDPPIVETTIGMGYRIVGQARRFEVTPLAWLTTARADGQPQSSYQAQGSALTRNTLFPGTQ